MAELKEIVKNVWLGEVTKDDYEGKIHGKWLIGDQQALHAPGYHRELRYKRWFGHSKKYAGKGYEAGTDPHQGRDEFVMLMKGGFQCWLIGQRHYLAYPESIELKAGIRRTWHLPPEEPYTEGLTICRFLKDEPTTLGGGPDYEFHPFDLEQGDAVPAYFMEPTTLQKWNYCLIDMFQGALHFSTGVSTSSELTVGYVQHVFIQKDAFPIRCVNPTMRVKGSMLYF